MTLSCLSGPRPTQQGPQVRPEEEDLSWVLIPTFQAIQNTPPSTLGWEPLWPPEICKLDPKVLVG